MTGIAGVLAWIEEHLGIDAAKGGLADAVLRHVKERCAELRVSPQSFLALVERDTTEQEGLVRVVSVGHTWFMRDREQLELVVGRFAGRGPGAPVRIWVAGCATGEEAYSIVLLADARGIPVRVLATDLNERSLSFAARARYGAWTVRGLTAPEREKLATPSGLFEIPERLRSLVTFQRHNLVDPPPRGASGFDAIVCRNVLLYFTKPRALDALRRMRSVLAPGGAIVTAASDVLADGTPSSDSELPRALAKSPTAPPTPGVADLTPPAPWVAEPAPPTKAPDAAPFSDYAPREAPAEDGHGAVERARSALDRGDVDEARDLLKAALERDPLSIEGYVLHGIACDASGNTYAAMASFRSALVLDPSLWIAELYLGLGHDRLGAKGDARRCLTRGLELHAKAPGLASLSSATQAMLAEGRAHLVEAAAAKLASL